MFQALIIMPVVVLVIHPFLGAVDTAAAVRVVMVEQVPPVLPILAAAVVVVLARVQAAALELLL
jgi:hypothetical protein